MGPPPAAAGNTTVQALNTSALFFIFFSVAAPAFLWIFNSNLDFLGHRAGPAWDPASLTRPTDDFPLGKAGAIIMVLIGMFMMALPFFLAKEKMMTFGIAQMVIIGVMFGLAFWRNWQTGVHYIPYLLLLIGMSLLVMAISMT